MCLCLCFILISGKSNNTSVWVFYIFISFHCLWCIFLSLPLEFVFDMPSLYRIYPLCKSESMYGFIICGFMFKITKFFTWYLWWTLLPRYAKCIPFKYTIASNRFRGLSDPMTALSHNILFSILDIGSAPRLTAPYPSADIFFITRV